VARGTFYYGLVKCYSWILRSFWNVVYIRSQRDDRPRTIAPSGKPGGRNTRNSSLDFKTLFLQDAREVLRGFHFLKAQLSKTEDLIYHHLALLVIGFDNSRNLRF